MQHIATFCAVQRTHKLLCITRRVTSQCRMSSLVSARSDGPDHADSLSTTYVSRANYSSHAACSGGTYISRGRVILCQHGAFSGVCALVASFVPAECPKGGGMWGIFGKPLKGAIWNTLGLHAVLTTYWRFLSVLDGACVACCPFLSTGSYHVRIQIHATCCCFPRCTTATFGAQKGTLWGCRVGVCDSASCQAGQETPYRRFAATCLHPQGTRHSVHGRGRCFCNPVLGP